MAATEPKSPTLAELPSLPTELQKEVAAEHPLKHVEVQEKNVLPTQEDIAKEKTPILAAGFDKTELKHVETDEKSGLPSAEGKSER